MNEPMTPDELASLASTLCRELGHPDVKVMVGDGPTHAVERSIRLSRRLTTLGPETLRWVVLHELGHVVLGHTSPSWRSRVRRTLGLLGLAFDAAGVAMAYALAHLLHLGVAAVALVAGIAVPSFLLVAQLVTGARRELEADAFALRHGCTPKEASRALAEVLSVEGRRIPPASLEALSCLLSRHLRHQSLARR